MAIEIRAITVLGTGVLGAQIAFQSAYHGYRVQSYDISEAALAAADDRFTTLAATYHEEVPDATAQRTEQARARISLTADLAAAVAGADLVIEAVPEVLEIKQQTYRDLAEVAPDHTIFATNSSTLLPSDLRDFTGRPGRFLALHFANQVWKFNTAEIMGTAQTEPEVFRAVVDFASSIGMVPIEVHKEKSGYVLNSLLVPFLNAGIELAAGDYAEPEAVDATWRIATGAPLGPFQILDVIGLTTPYNILMADERTRGLAAWLKENYIDKGKLGVATGEGFYKYS